MTDYKSNRFPSTSGHRLINLPARSAVNEVADYGYFDVDANLATNDTIKLFTLPKGATLLDLYVSNSASLGSTANCVVGITGDTDKFITTTALTSAKVTRLNNADGALYEATSDTDVFLTAASIATPATGARVSFVALISFANLG